MYQFIAYKSDPIYTFLSCSSQEFRGISSEFFSRPGFVLFVLFCYSISHLSLSLHISDAKTCIPLLSTPHPYLISGHQVK